MQAEGTRWVALSTKRKLGAFHIQTHSEHYKYKYTESIAKLQMQAHMDDKYKRNKHKQEEDEGVCELKRKLAP